MQQVTAVRALSLSMTNSGIYHPRSMAVSVSSDGVSYAFMGNAAVPSPDTIDFSVGWSQLLVAANARFVRYTFSHISWVFVSELEILGIPSAPSPLPSVFISINPEEVTLYASQTQQFTATVTGTSNTAVNWQVITPNGGSIVNGFYTAPASVPAPLTAAITATSQANPNNATSAVVSLAPDPTVISMVGPVNPSSGSGVSQLFRFDARPVGGNLIEMAILFNTTLSDTNGCLVTFDPTTNWLYLRSDNALSWQAAQPGTPAFLVNSRCSIDVGNSSVQPSGTGLSLNLSMTFFSAWSGTQPYIFMSATDSDLNSVYYTIVGFWSIP